ncbi:TetR family transcriptional regulator [Catellatospora sp. TT07R-123]|uniref:TetR/AcrR family transcriptional regulator n=1 Tax=Catellatospora sp. TT07R-123 TaxID=2733863 RepID=UPI001B0C08CD|nr:TetR/AcrR family transcriptional regulator [Catellatospora sp. TT07R-123]GHJ48290.1 TetR family transcriptional regulator [Catellatospora sp. TT07R-123]
MSTPGAGGRRADAVRNRQLALEAATALLADRGTPLTVEAIAKRAGLGMGTVVRAFGGKDALLDAAVSGLLAPVVHRGRDLLAASSPEQALRAFLAELIAFQSAHHAIADQVDGLDLPATSALRTELERLVEDMVIGARADGAIRTDLEPALLTTLIGQTAYAIARAQPVSPHLRESFITVFMDGLRPQPAVQAGRPTREGNRGGGLRR